MITNILHAGETIQTRAGSVFFWMTQCDGKILATHAGFLAADKSRATRLSVLDWPQSGDLSERDSTGDGTREMEIDENGIIIGWIDGLPQAKRIVTEARRLLADAVSMCVGSIADDLYFPHPARQTEYHLDGDRRRVVAFAGSCSGFVVQCFSVANIHLIVDEDNSCPKLSFEELRTVAPHIIDGRLRSRGVLRRAVRDWKLTLPCSMLMPGYLHATFKNDEYPYVPSKEDMYMLSDEL